jgi:Ca2+-binding RTX toxin-like protein
VLTGDGADVVAGTSEANFIQVNGGDDDVRAQGGDDTVEGGAGDDLLRGGGGQDLLIGGAGADRLRGDGGADELRGGSTGDKLSGGGGADKLLGGGGRDDLSGGAGRDLLFGQSGDDLFTFATVAEMGITKATSDIIGDFSPGDRIRLADIDADASTRIDDAFTFIDSLDFSGSAGELRWFQNAANTFLQCDVDGDGAVDGWLRLTGLHTLSEGDFIL